MYSRIDRERILYIALTSIQLHFNNQKFKIPSEWLIEKTLVEKRGTFVTLTKNHDLRGCIGSILPSKPLWEDVSENAAHAAFHDPRFDPVSEYELPDISLEVSILTVPTQVKYTSFQELLQNIKPLVDGIIIQSGFSKATFLPQVWEDIPDPCQFFKHLCLKAGLTGNFYLTHFSDLLIYTYNAEIISADSTH